MRLTLHMQRWICTYNVMTGWPDVPHWRECTQSQPGWIPSEHCCVVSVTYIEQFGTFTSLALHSLETKGEGRECRGCKGVRGEETLSGVWAHTYAYSEGNAFKMLLTCKDPILSHLCTLMDHAKCQKSHDDNWSDQRDDFVNVCCGKIYIYKEIAPM